MGVARRDSGVATRTSSTRWCSTVPGHGRRTAAAQRGAAHLALIDRAVRTASDPRAGELAVRLAYIIASAKGTIAPTGVSIATQVAALVRDRASASADLRDLFDDASEAAAPTSSSLLNERRDARVSRRATAGSRRCSSSCSIEAMNAVPALVRALDTLDRAAIPESCAALPSSTLLGPHFAGGSASSARSGRPSRKSS